MSLILVALGFIGSYITKLYSILFVEIRLEKDVASSLYNHLSKKEHKKFILRTAFTKTPTDIPKVQTSLHFEGFPFLYSMCERELKAGWTAMEQVCTVSTLFFFRNKLFTHIQNILALEQLQKDVHVRMYLCNSFTITNRITKGTIPKLPEACVASLSTIVEDFVSGKRNKLGILLHGKPGNGKTSLVKYLAHTHHMDVYIPLFNKNMTNGEMIEMFTKIPNTSKSIVLFEDFDNVFDKRTPIFDKASFSFDAFINLLDGVYCDNSNRIFIMTTNSLDKIDRALKHRPSRFDLLLEIDNPTYEERLNILKPHLNGLSEIVAHLTDGQSAAVVSEITKRTLTHESVELEVKNIINSFSEHEAEQV